MPNAHCPIGKWWKVTTIVLINNVQLRDTLRFACSLERLNIVVLGEPPGWYLGHTIFYPLSQTPDANTRRSLQRVIESPLVSETFILLSSREESGLVVLNKKQLEELLTRSSIDYLSIQLPKPIVNYSLGELSKTEYEI
jgi:hypothetical protein